MLRAIRAQNYETPTPIQLEAIPAVLAGDDILAAAQTGTGKTAAFTLPLIQRLMSTPARTDGKRRPVRALVLAPTRELALQVGDSVSRYGAHTSVTNVTIFGGVGMGPQIDALRAGRDVVIATPGRLLDHVSRNTIDLSSVELLVLDEADRMLDMGFVCDIKRILGLIPQQRQNLLFSATFSKEIRDFADRLLRHPRRIDVAPPNSTAERVEQTMFHVERAAKTELLADLIHRNGWSQVLVFTRTKHGANNLARKLARAGLVSAVIHGNKSQNARVRALEDFKRGKVRVLVATDIAARGLDIDSLPHVVNFELPNVPEDYVHRIGRTGRAGASGEAVSLVSPEEKPLLRDIERLLGNRLDVRASDQTVMTSKTESSSNRVSVHSEQTASGHSRGTKRDSVASNEQRAGGRGGMPKHLARASGGASSRPAVMGKRAPPNFKDLRMAIGNVKWFNPTKGFGFIAPENAGKDVFVHVSALQRAGIGALEEGQKVEYELGDGRDGRTAAENLRLVD